MIKLTEERIVDELYARIRVPKGTQSRVAFWYAVLNLLYPQYSCIDIDSAIVNQWSLRALEGIKIIARGIVLELRFIGFEDATP